MQHFPYSAGQQALSSTGVEATALSKKDQLMSSLEKAVRGEAFNREVEEATILQCQSIHSRESRIRESYHPNSYYDDEAIKKMVPTLSIGGSGVKVGRMDTPSGKMRSVVRAKIKSPNKNSVVCVTDCLLKTYTIPLVKAVVERSESCLFQASKEVIKNPQVKAHHPSVKSISAFSDQNGNVCLKTGFQIFFSVSSQESDTGLDVQIDYENTLQMKDKEKNLVNMNCTNKTWLAKSVDIDLQHSIRLPKEVEMTEFS